MCRLVVVQFYVCYCNLAVVCADLVLFNFIVVCYCNLVVVCADLVFSFILVCYCNLVVVCADLVLFSSICLLM